MKYVPQRSIATTVKSTSVPTGTKRREDLRAGTTFSQNGTRNHKVNSIHVKSAKKSLYSCRYRYQWVMHSGANTVQRTMWFFVLSQQPVLNSENGFAPYVQDIDGKFLSRLPLLLFHHEMLSDTCCLVNELYHITNTKEWRKCKYEAEKFKIISK